MVDRRALLEYNDLIAQVENTREQLNRLIEAQREVLHDSVKGSNPCYPYEPIKFHIEGIGDKVTNSDIERMKHILVERERQLKDKRFEVEMWINMLPSRMQRIVRLKFLEGKTWSEVAMRVGSKNVSGDAIRKEFWGFMDKNQKK